MSERQNNYALDKIKTKIDWYWKNAKSNRRRYFFLRYLIIALGTIVTLITTIIASYDESILGDFHYLFTFSAPILAGVLTIANTISQNFQWGEAWKDMILNAEKLEKLRDEYLLGKCSDSDCLSKMHDMVIEETESFFGRILSFKKGNKE